MLPRAVCEAGYQTWDPKHQRKSNFSIFPFRDCAFGVMLQTLPNLTRFSFKGLIVLLLDPQSIMNWFFFKVWGLDRSLWFLHMDVQVSQTVYKEEHLFFIELLIYLCQQSVGRICVGLFLYSILFQWFMFYPFANYTVLITIGFVIYNLKLDNKKENP